MNIPQTTKWFKYYNLNPKNKKTTDCVIRAIAGALNKTYAEVFGDICIISMKTGYYVDDRRCYKKYLESIGLQIQKQPRKVNGKKYTLKEFIDDNKFNNQVYLVNLANHLTLVKDNVCCDVWDCTDYTVGNYWVVK